ncbi:single-stranded-DNA-specific exonuclease RecJ [Roseicyclus sp. F158]|uniref:Single-stranded-DNA-specific exonuclease RecJ n=1 Tax=Tropicimonas omnivorans TaxID=3075590 RepID=A0ABU3DLN2_9RHOB|nr:single-stranded-DNA-specific exonuclease RecJ [Roseicyclus sp. F158]MDT0684027.1 single-stranded-DNA-specific exonuclease RecJ [Roseicyclus sp. F158]
MPRDLVTQAFLGVDSSLTGRLWAGPTVEEDRKAEALVQETGLPDALCRILALRGVAGPDCAAHLEPKLRDLMPDPRSLKDMEIASARLLKAATDRERVAIFADYDVDGATSAAVLHDWFAAHGLTPTIYVPDRIAEGYGPNAPAMEKLAASHDLIVCVDCGTLAHEALEAAAMTDVVVLDHHLGGETLPRAVAVVNPNRQDESGALAHLCAAAVCFLAVVEANRQARGAGHPTPDPVPLLDLVALATVADVAPLIGVNRAFVRAGLAVMHRRARPGLAALADESGLSEAPAAYHLGYMLGPRINAGGRIGRADLGARLLTTRDGPEAQSLAEKLNALNGERRDIEARVTEEATEQAIARGADAPLIWASGDGWHPGVVGIVASRLKEAFGRPAVVIGTDGGIGKGSGRSVPGIDLGAAVHRLSREGLLIAGGGHKMAAGLTAEAGRIDAAMERLSELLEAQGSGSGAARELRLDGLMMPGAANVEMIEALESAGPFGASAPAPRFAIPGAAIHSARRVGDGHLKLTVSDGLGPRLDAIAFGVFRSDLGPALEAHGGARFHLAGRFEINSWNGRRSAQLRLEDAAKA